MEPGGGGGGGGPPVFDYYVSPTGSALNDGLTPATAWPFSYPLAGAGGVVQPGHTIGLADGVYTAATFTTSLQGTALLPITFRAVNWGMAIIDSTTAGGGHLFDLAAAAKYVRLWGLRFRYTASSVRTSSISGSTPSDIDNRWIKVVANAGSYNKIINCIIHDTGDGPTDQSVATAYGTEWYGNICFNGGWDGPDRGHGHGHYWQNSSIADKSTIDSIVFGFFNTGLKFGGSATSRVQRFLVRGCAVFHNSLVSITVEGTPFFNDQLGAAANDEIGNTTVEDSTLIYGEPHWDSQALSFNNSLNATGGYFIGQRNILLGCAFLGPVGPGMAITWVDNKMGYNGQTPVAGRRMLFVRRNTGVPHSAFTIDRNTYAVKQSSLPWAGFEGASQVDGGNFANWKSVTGWDAHSTDLESLFFSGPPDIIYRPNLYETGCGLIYCHNWGVPEFTGTASTKTLTKTSHGYSNDTRVALSFLTGGTGLSRNTAYYVVGATVNTLQLSLTLGGAPIDPITDITVATVVPASLSVDLSKLGLVNGDSYKIWHCYNLVTNPTSASLGTPDYTGTYDASTALVLNQVGYTQPIPYGWTGAQSPSTAPQFNAFIVRKT